MFEEQKNNNEALEQNQEKTLESPEEKVKKIRIIGATKDPNFEGSTIIKTEDEEGRVVGYAIRKNSEGQLEGNQIGYMKDGSTGAVYQLHESDFDKLRDMGILESYEGALATESSEKINNANLEMLRLFGEGDKIDPSWGRDPGELLTPARRSLEGMNDEDQEKVATEFFNKTIGRDISNNRYAYHVYRHFKSGAFGQKFKQLEDDRLKAAGYAGFKL
ncbi:MAG: hypothetical protein ACD_8C00033G0002 [uncultured bacterium]|nr:MAG: hypothetical protein ACD_8C00033G0002 [uncultured bacterium]